MYIISYTSESGITLGCTGTSFADAVATLSEEFGEEVISVYAAAREELLDVIADARELLTEEELRGSGAVSRDRPAPDPDASVRAPARVTDGGDTAEQHPPFDIPPDLRSEAPEPRAAAEVPERQASELMCVVCGDGITSEMAKASVLMFNERRCAECMA